MKIEIGARVRVNTTLEPGMRVEGFRTDHIKDGKRWGTVIATVEGLCDGGCHVHVNVNSGEGVGLVPIEAIQELREEDRDDAESSEQHAQVGAGSDVQRLPGPFAEPESKRAVPIALPAPSEEGEGAAQALSSQTWFVLRQLGDAIARAQAPGSGYGIAHVRKTYEVVIEELLSGRE